MLWRVIKNKHGYTLTELIVVMGVVTLLLGITFGAYSSTRKQKYMQHTLDLIQVSIRDTFIDMIATRVENNGTNCGAGGGKAAQIKAIRIKMGTSAPSDFLKRVSMCHTTGALGIPSVLGEPEVVGSISPAEGSNYGQSIIASFDTPFDTTYPDKTTTTNGFIYLIFTSPYGGYYSYYTPETDPDTADANFGSLGWTKDANLIYKPDTATPPSSGTLDPGYLRLYVGTSASDERKVLITQKGNVEID